ncbi:MAG: DbpA RNA binding domain-containing protein, partial [Prevotella sp.]|nr:DbpA RNA binding domain-containing protein [Prevotella sp.]
ILLSATDANEIPSFVNMGKTVRLDFLSDTQIPDRINIYKVSSPDKDKLETLARLLCDFGDTSTIVFLNFRDSVDRVTDFLTEKGFTVSGFHGGKDQKEREDALYKFRNGSANVLVGTDLASRGLDIPEVDNIIHYHLPIGEDEYIHRVGRTARWQSTGRAFFLLSPEETIPEYVKEKPEEYVISSPASATPPQARMVTLYIGKGKKDKLSKGDILGFLCKKGGLTANEIGRIDVKERCSYVAVARNCWQSLIQRTANEKIKGIKTIIQLIK